LPINILGRVTMTYFGMELLVKDHFMKLYGYVMEIPVVLSLKTTVTQWELL
jgi:hypothetical protein